MVLHWQLYSMTMLENSKYEMKGGEYHDW